MQDPHPSEGWEQEEDEPPQVLVPRRPNWITRLRRMVRKHWQPSGISVPEVDPELPRLSGIERAAEVMRHCLASAEHWISPNGWLREWLRMILKAVLALALPVLLLVPLITFALRQFQTWAMLLAQTSNHLLYFPLTGLLLLGLICALVYFGKSLRRRDPRERYNSPYYN